MSNTLPLVRPGLILPNVTVAELRQHLARLPAEILQDYGRRSFTLATYIINAFTGPQWVEQNVIANTLSAAGKTGFFQMEFGDDIARETKSLRMFELAETLFNLQMVEGFYECVERLKTGGPDQIEATMAELEFAKLLYWHNIDFRFVTPEKSAGGKNYDFEIWLKSHPTVCADAKCKLESTDIDADSVRNTLRKGRDQLPKDKPGIIYVKVPQHWFEQPTMAAELETLAKNFLRSTERVVLVCYYISHLSFEPENKRTLHQHAFQEHQNPKTRFLFRDWHLFKNYTVPPEWVDGRPPTWIPLMTFV